MELLSHLTHAESSGLSTTARGEYSKYSCGQNIQNNNASPPQHPEIMTFCYL